MITTYWVSTINLDPGFQSKNCRLDIAAEDYEAQVKRLTKLFGEPEQHGEKETGYMMCATFPNTMACVIMDRVTQ